MEILIISMLSSKYRRARMSKILANEGVAFRFVDGVDVASEPKELMSRVSEDCKRNLLPRELGCFLSHVKCWEQVVVENLSNVLILEDDVHLHPGFKHLLGVRFPDEKIAIYKVETLLATVTARIKPEIDVSVFRFHELHSDHYGAAGYIINRATALYLLKFVPEMLRAIDTELFSWSRGVIKELAVYQCVPGAIMQDIVLPVGEQDPALTSLIGNSRGEILIEGLNNRKPSAYRLPGIRKLYRVFRTFCLLPSGRMRIRVGFSSKLRS